jgi:hypothetical protein
MKPTDTNRNYILLLKLEVCFMKAVCTVKCPVPNHNILTRITEHLPC